MCSSKLALKFSSSKIPLDFPNFGWIYPVDLISNPLEYFENNHAGAQLIPLGFNSTGLSSLAAGIQAATPKARYLWPEIQQLDPRHDNGSLCLASDVDKRQVVANCREGTS